MATVGSKKGHASTKTTAKTANITLKNNDNGTGDGCSDIESKEKSIEDSADDFLCSPSSDTEDHDGSLSHVSATNSRSNSVCVALLTVASLCTRLYNIEEPPHVCWDETHFGKMGSWYINRTFFFDVHPPLGKMLIGLAGYLTGYNGSFPFAKPGDEYGDTEYVGMRIFCAALGSSLVPLTYKSVLLLSHSMVAAILAACFVLFDTGTLTLSRHILLDPILLFFILAATYAYLHFLACRDRPFSIQWWLWLALTGVYLACSIGVKFVGLFVILLIGLTTAWDLWSLLGNMDMPFTKFLKHFAARAVCLIGVPAIVYVLVFGIHFRVLNHSGSGDGFFSSAFQSQLIGNRLHNATMPEFIAYGANITIKQRRTGGAYLHSHWHIYPEEHPPKQQQVTTYSHKDENNVFMIKPADRSASATELPVLVRNGDLVRFEHVMTRRNLHSHREPAPLSKRHFQVSCYGQNGTGDANDIWVVEVEGADKGTPVMAVRSRIRIIHYHVRCALYSHDKKLPKWGWDQLEVTCNPNARDKNAVWNVEEVWDKRLPQVNFEVYSPSLIEKLVESHAVMTQGNSGLKPKEGEVTSRPWQWPIDQRGQLFSGKDLRIYLLGNPVLFWGLLAIKPVFLLLYIIHAIRAKRQCLMSQSLEAYTRRTFRACWWLLGGWLLHYAPFWTMTRVLYFHHYFPAFLYSAMLGGMMLDYIITSICLLVPDHLMGAVFHILFGGVLAGIVFSFYLFHPLAYGMTGSLSSSPDSMMAGLKWMQTWDF